MKSQRTPYNIGFLKLCLEVKLGGLKNRSLSCEIDGVASRVARYCSNGAILTDGGN